MKTIAENILQIVRILKLWNGRRIVYPGLPGHIEVITNPEFIIPEYSINPETDGFREKDMFNKRPCKAYALVRVYLDNAPDESWIEIDKKGGPAIEIYLGLGGCYMHGNIYLECPSEFKDSWTAFERDAEIDGLYIFTTGAGHTGPFNIYEADSFFRILLDSDPRNIDLDRLV